MRSLVQQKIVIVGGHGKIALRLAKLLSPKHSVTSIIRTPEHNDDIKETGSNPHLLSLEDASVEEFASTFQGTDLVYFTAGAGGKGGPERTRKVDYEGAVKVFDAIEAVQGNKPRLVLISLLDSRDASKVPSHYTEEDIKVSEGWRKTIGSYVDAKYAADQNLSKRTAFKWTILRPGTLTDEPGKGTASIGRTHLTPKISRDDVASVLALLAAREDAAGLGIDFAGGDAPIEEALDEFIKRGESDFLG